MSAGGGRTVRLARLKHCEEETCTKEPRQLYRQERSKGEELHVELGGAPAH